MNCEAILETSVGPIKILANGPQSLYVTSDELVVRKVPYRASCHTQPGKYELNRSQCYIRRNDGWFPNDYAIPHGFNTIVDEINRVVSKFMVSDEGRQLARNGEIKCLIDSRNSLKDKLAELNNTVVDTHDAIAGIDKRLKELAQSIG